MENCQTLLGWLNANSGFGDIAGWFSGIVTFAALCIAYCSARWAIIQWRTRYLTEEWVKTVEFLYEKTEYLIPEKNEKYEESYEGTEKVKYQLVARRSIAYVDDLYNLKMGEHLNAWLSGSVDLFVKPHQKWFSDHPQFYSKEFVCFVNRELSKPDS